jgi:PAS domain S-box-containing protein
VSNIDQQSTDLTLEESEARFRAIFDGIQEAIFIHDIDTGAILATNRRACEMYGLGEAEILAASIEDLSGGMPPYAQADAALWIMRAAAGEPQSFEWLARRSDGCLFWVEINMRCAELAGRERVLVVVRDISRRKAQEEELRQNLEHQVQLNKKLEEAHNQLLQSEKLASIGQLAAGVAHELNSPIGFVHSNLGSLETYLHDLFAIIDASEGQGASLEAVQQVKAEKDYAYLKRDIGELMAESKDGLTRVRKIVQDLKDFSRVGGTDWQWTDLHTGLDSTLNIVWNEIKYKCKVHKEYGDLPEVHCLPSQLNQVFMNLLVNAGQAIVNQGEITIRTGRQDDRVWIEVADTGSGIPGENLTRIFEPFFTTKPVGKGTGLGLSLSYGIVVKHHGKIEVKSEVGKGTTFRVTLPIDPTLENPAGAPT